MFMEMKILKCDELENEISGVTMFLQVIWIKVIDTYLI